MTRIAGTAMSLVKQANWYRSRHLFFAVKNARQYGLLGQPEGVWGVKFVDFVEAGV